MYQNLTKDIILILIVAAGAVSFFYNPMGGDSVKYLQTLAGGIVGFYIGIKELPLGRQVSTIGKIFKKQK